MDENNALIINIAEMIAPSVGSRDVIEVVRSKIIENPVEVVYLDFSKVAFISRSAAHEFLLVQQTLHEKNRQLSFINTNDEVKEMIRIVAANRALPEKPKPKFEPEKVDAHTLLGV